MESVAAVHTKPTSASGEGCGWEAWGGGVGCFWLTAPSLFFSMINGVFACGAPVTDKLTEVLRDRPLPPKHRSPCASKHGRHQWVVGAELSVCVVANEWGGGGGRAEHVVNADT